LLRFLLTLACAASLISCHPASAQAPVEQWQLCPHDALAGPADFEHPPPGEAISGTADKLTTYPNGIAELSGKVVVRQQNRAVLADRVTLNRTTGIGDAAGKVTYRTPDYEISAERADFELNNETVQFTSARYRRPDLNVQGKAQGIQRDEEGVTYLKNATYSTCPAEQEDWVLKAGRVKLDPFTQHGTARDVTLSFKGVPFLYSPWFGFPIGDERKSGFLVPGIGTTSSGGTEFSLPYYWNIAPQADATIVPRYLSNRGVQLQNELRYLNRQGSWQLDADYLEDRKFTDQRSFTRLRHGGRLGRRWSTSIDASDVSDRDYFDDLGTSLNETSRTHLLRRADLDYYADLYTLRGRIESYQTVDDSIASADRPYKRLPQLSLRTQLPDLTGGLRFDLNAEWVQFEREESDTGSRLDLQPKASLPLGGTFWFLTPTLMLRHTEYELDRTSDGPEGPTRTLPVSSLDAGLFFDRDLGARGRFVQTLEPRLYYLNVPFEDQTDIPVFDSSEFDFSFAQLFRDNRFTGGDRLGDADQLTLALSTRLLERSSGSEKLSTSIGQIVYFRDREVTLLDEAPALESRSDLIGELRAAIDEIWSTRATLRWNPERDETDQSLAQIQYRADNNHIANFTYRFRRDEQEQVDLSFRWALSPRWRLMGRYYYSLREDQILETLAGLEYESCCWLARAVTREFLIDEAEDPERSFLFELVLKGIGPIGSGANRELENAILGYEAEQTNSLP
jgi:LPS-assembly protein